MRVASLIALGLGFLLAAIWLLQDMGSLDLLDHPEWGAIALVLFGITLGLLEPVRRGGDPG